MDVDHDDAFKLIEDVPNCLIWTSIAQNFFELYISKYRVENLAQRAIDPHNYLDSTW